MYAASGKGPTAPPRLTAARLRTSRLGTPRQDYIHRRGRRNALANLMDRSPHGGAEVAMSAASLPSWSPLNMQLAAEHAARCFGSAPIFPTADAEQLEQDFDERCRVSE